MRYFTTNATWQILTASSNVAFQVTGSGPVEAGLANNATPPVAGFIYAPGSGDRGALTEIFPSATGNTIWARSSVPSTVVIG